MADLIYRGVRIVQRAASTQLSHSVMGFPVTHVFQTLDDFDDHALSIVYSNFGSPEDACMAVDLCEWLATRYGPPAKSWRFSDLLRFRGKPELVRGALLDIRDLIDKGDVYSVEPDEISDAVLDCIRKLELDIR